MQVLRWQEAIAPQEQELFQRMQREGLTPYTCMLYIVIRTKKFSIVCAALFVLYYPTMLIQLGI